MDTPIRTHIEHLPQFNFTVVVKIYDYFFEFFIYDIEGWNEIDKDGNVSGPLWHKAGSTCSPDLVETLEESEVYLHGSVKWDGCSNWHFDEQNRVMLHGCCRQDIQRYGDVMGWCWDFTSKNCSHWYWD